MSTGVSTALYRCTIYVKLIPIPERNKPNMPVETVVVTGSSAGLGRAIAKEFGKRGAQVALLARGKQGLDAAAEEVEALGGKALPIPTDVSDSNAVDAAAESAERHFGPIDIWINNAMVTIFSPVLEIKPEEYKRGRCTKANVTCPTQMALIQLNEGKQQ